MYINSLRSPHARDAMFWRYFQFTLLFWVTFTVSPFPHSPTRLWVQSSLSALLLGISSCFWLCLDIRLCVDTTLTGLPLSRQNRLGHYRLDTDLSSVSMPWVLALALGTV